MRSNVLLVVDDKKDLAVLSDHLRSAYNVFIAGSMEEARQVVQKTTFHLILCAVDGPVMNGWSPISHFRTGTASTRTTDNFLSKLHQCIAMHVHDKSLNVDWLARHLHMSRPTLYRKIKTMTGLTPNGLIIRARLNQASELLAAADYKIFEVAKMVGFYSQSSFGKAFLKQFKITPVEYQRRKRHSVCG